MLTNVLGAGRVGYSKGRVVEALQLALGGAQWGRFDITLSRDTPWFRLIAAAMNKRSAMTSICTGDQGIFVRRALLERIGGIPDQPLMEDIELSKRLRRLAKPTRIRTVLGNACRQVILESLCFDRLETSFRMICVGNHRHLPT